MTSPKLLTLLVFLPLLGLAPPTGQPGAGEPRVRFTSVQVFVDSGPAPLAAWQLEVRAIAGDVRIVGIEGGAHEAFATPPFHDPRAIRSERVIVAAFSTAAAVALPSGRTRVTTIHVQIIGDAPPRFEARLHAAATVGGGRVEAEVMLEQEEQS